MSVIVPASIFESWIWHSVASRRKHAAILTQDVGAESMNAVRLRRTEEFAEQDASQAAILPVVHDDEAEFDRIRIAGRFITGDADGFPAGFRDERHAVAVIDGGQIAGHGRSQFGNGGEKTLIDCLRTGVVEHLDQEAVVLPSNGWMWMEVPSLRAASDSISIIDFTFIPHLDMRKWGGRFAVFPRSPMRAANEAIGRPGRLSWIGRPPVAPNFL